MSVDVHRGRLHVSGRISQLVATLDKATGEVMKKKPKVVKPGSVARIKIELDQMVPLEAPTRIVLRANGETVAAGLVEWGLEKAIDVNTSDGNSESSKADFQAAQPDIHPGYALFEILTLTDVSSHDVRGYINLLPRSVIEGFMWCVTLDINQCCGKANRARHDMSLRSAAVGEANAPYYRWQIFGD